ncbi:MAG: ZIP family metal transporter [Planctomycetota bacterium]|nr:ZIP family metal transporter [Planctomycetota bacterium]
MPSFAIGVLIAYSAAVVLASVLGGMLPEWIRLTHSRMQLMISFVGGIMLGIGIFHMIPHALLATGGSVTGSDIEAVVKGVMLGLLATFFLLRFFQFHQHGPEDFGYQGEKQGSDPQATGRCSEHPHPSHPHHDCGPAKHSRWLLVLLGLGVHTLMDGIALASGVFVEAGHAHSSVPPGFAIFFAVLLHKPLDAVSVTSLMQDASSLNRRLLVNVGFALMCPIGALLFFAGVSFGGEGLATSMVTWGLAFSAGVFLCIALSDLLPEMEFHTHNRIPLSLALIAGVLSAYAIGLLEGSAAHAPESEETSAQHDHSH